MERKIYILTENLDEGVVHLWHIEAADKYAMARNILENRDYFYEVFYNRRSGLYNWHKNKNGVSPLELLDAIANTYIDGDSLTRFQIHELDLQKTGAIATDVTFTSQEEAEGFRAKYHLV